jgi:hypothetical protein
MYASDAIYIEKCLLLGLGDNLVYSYTGHYHAALVGRARRHRVVVVETNFIAAIKQRTSIFPAVENLFGKI